ncbi:MAG: hypothetical protein OHK006_20100 [Thermodesulfovibrionales bacterium]
MPERGGRLTVNLSEQLLAILACPKCKGDIAWREKEQLIVCARCGLGYPVRDGIPVMLIDEALELGAGTAEDTTDRQEGEL